MDARATTTGTSQPSGRWLAGRYRLESVLGRGGMGVVWAAHDEVLDRPVAIKEVTPVAGLDQVERDEMRRRTLHEARAAARMSSPAVVMVYDVVEQASEPWIVMERLAPRTLADVLDERGPLPPGEVATLGLRLLDALDAAHRAGVLHRDVKPSNAMFRGDPAAGAVMAQAVLTDFGIARFLGDPTATATGTLIGSPAFVAPERARGERATAASDLWGLGVTLWIAAEGVSPFHREGTLQTLTAVLTEDLPLPRSTGPLATILTGLLQKDPAHRLSAARLRPLLEQAQGRDSAEATDSADQTVVLRTLPAAGAAGARAAGAAAVGAAGAVAAGAFAAGAGHPPVVDRAKLAPVPPQQLPPPQSPQPPPSPQPPHSPEQPQPQPSEQLARIQPQPLQHEQARTPVAWPDGGPAGAQGPKQRSRRPLLAAVSGLAAVIALVAFALGAGGGRQQDAAAGSRPAPTPTASVNSGAAADPKTAASTTATSPTSADGGGQATGPAVAASTAAAGVVPTGSAATGSAPSASTTGDSTSASGPTNSASASQSPAASSPSQSSAASQSTANQGSSATAQAAGVPAGLRRYTDRTGFSVAVPSGWTTERRNGLVYLRDPNSSAYLLVDQSDKPKSDPVRDWQTQEPRVSQRLSNYRRIRIDPLELNGWRGADWEFTHGSGTHVLNRNLVTGPKQAYALYWSAPDRTWAQSRALFDQVSSSFVPRS